MAISKGTQPKGMVANKKSSVMEVSNDGCDWSISFVMEKLGTRLKLP